MRKLGNNLTKSVISEYSLCFEDDVVFPAHRERLLAASPYFESLLKGDWKKVEEVLIEGCQPGAFRVLLR